MGGDRPSRFRKVTVAACAAAVAASVGLAASPAPAELQVLDKVQRYCAVSWKHAGIHPQDWGDCTQEALVQLLERVPQERLGAALGDAASGERQELKRAIWRTAQRWRRSPRFLPLDAKQHVDSRQNEGSFESADWLNRAMQVLSPRQQEVLTLWSQGWSIDEIARQLDISAARASDEKYKALRKLQREADV